MKNFTQFLLKTKDSAIEILERFSYMIDSRAIIRCLLYILSVVTGVLGICIGNPVLCILTAMLLYTLNIR